MTASRLPLAVVISPIPSNEENQHSPRLCAYAREQEQPYIPKAIPQVSPSNAIAISIEIQEAFDELHRKNTNPNQYFFNLVVGEVFHHQFSCTLESLNQLRNDLVYEISANVNDIQWFFGDCWIFKMTSKLSTRKHRISKILSTFKQLLEIPEVLLCSKFHDFLKIKVISACTFLLVMIRVGRSKLVLKKQAGEMKVKMKEELYLSLFSNLNRDARHTHNFAADYRDSFRDFGCEMIPLLVYDHHVKFILKSYRLGQEEEAVDIYGPCGRKYFEIIETNDTIFTLFHPQTMQKLLEIYGESIGGDQAFHLMRTLPYSPRSVKTCLIVKNKTDFNFTMLPNSGVSEKNLNLICYKVRGTYHIINSTTPGNRSSLHCTIFRTASGSWSVSIPANTDALLFIGIAASIQYSNHRKNIQSNTRNQQP